MSKLSNIRRDRFFAGAFFEWHYGVTGMLNSGLIVGDVDWVSSTKSEVVPSL